MNRHIINASFGILVSLVLANAAVFSDSSQMPVKPGPLAYSVNPACYAAGKAIAVNTCMNAGGAADSFSITPALPAGLSINKMTGMVTGTPIAVSAQASYTIYAKNAHGTASVALVIRIIPVSQDTVVASLLDSAYTRIADSTGVYFQQAVAAPDRNIRITTTKPVNGTVRIVADTSLRAPSGKKIVTVSTITLSDSLSRYMTYSEIRLSYSGTQLGNIKPNSLTIVWHNDQTDTWESVSSTVTDSVATARVTHFSTYAVMGDLQSTGVGQPMRSAFATHATAQTHSYSVTGRRMTLNAGKARMVRLSVNKAATVVTATRSTNAK